MILDPDYARVFTQARIVAWQYGFACVPHGSYTRDLDLLLVPWEERATDKIAEQVIRIIADACDLAIHGTAQRPMDYALKPHGRRAYTLHFKDAKDRRWIDLSVIPSAPRGSAEGEQEYESWFPSSALGGKGGGDAQA